jgi:hypothetical protein
VVAGRGSDYAILKKYHTALAFDVEHTEADPAQN